MERAVGPEGQLILENNEIILVNEGDTASENEA